MKLIENRYSVNYSYKQVWKITTVKSGLNYRKPHITNPPQMMPKIN